MGEVVKGDIVVMPFPFSDLSKSKRRPALVLATLPGDDVILCQITSVDRNDRWALPLSDGDIEGGALGQPGFIRPARLFTADCRVIIYRVGRVRHSLQDKVVEQILRILRA
ncbi:MAG: type II toxin-antitoxin system PemK/MazF family toxin [Calditrichaeota bacterium]|nr:type II toxin-antitoxin system PemK/MazF family toxin [Calditrichota bacterium]